MSTFNFQQDDGGLISFHCQIRIKFYAPPVIIETEDHSIIIFPVLFVMFPSALWRISVKRCWVLDAVRACQYRWGKIISLHPLSLFFHCYYTLYMVKIILLLKLIFLLFIILIIPVWIADWREEAHQQHQQHQRVHYTALSIYLSIYYLSTYLLSTYLLPM